MGERGGRGDGREGWEGRWERGVGGEMGEGWEGRWDRVGGEKGGGQAMHTAGEVLTYPVLCPLWPVII